MKICKDIVYSNKAPELMLDLYLPDEDDFDVFVYFHGGGLEKGSKSGASVYNFAQYLAERGIAVASVEYRMYPTYKYPDFLVDAADSVKFIADNIKNYGNGKRIYLYRLYKRRYYGRIR